MVPLDGRTAEADSPSIPVKQRIAFVDIARAVGAILVFYSHIAEQWVAKRNDYAPYVEVIDALTSDPMHMGLQGIGQIAVPLFFLVSGFVVTPIAIRQGQAKFALNRVLRVYPPMIFTVLLTALVLSVGIDPLSTGQLQTINPLTLLTNSLLVNYIIFPQVVLVGVAWTLVIEVIFYILLTLLLPVFRRMVWLALAIELVFVFAVLMTRSQFGNSYSLFGVNVSYLPIPIIGQIIWACCAKKIPNWLGGTYIALAWSLYVLADIVDVGRVDDSYNLAMAVAVLCFLVGLFAEPLLRERKFWTWLSERSYSLYLLHGLIAFIVLDLLRPAVPLLFAIPIAVAVTFGVVELSYRWVEKPSHRLARKLSRRRVDPESLDRAPNVLGDDDADDRDLDDEVETTGDRIAGRIDDEYDADDFPNADDDVVDAEDADDRPARGARRRAGADDELDSAAFLAAEMTDQLPLVRVAPRLARPVVARPGRPGGPPTARPLPRRPVPADRAGNGPEPTEETSDRAERRPLPGQAEQTALISRLSGQDDRAERGAAVEQTALIDQLELADESSRPSQPSRSSAPRQHGQPGQPGLPRRPSLRPRVGQPVDQGQSPERDQSSRVGPRPMRPVRLDRPDAPGGPDDAESTQVTESPDSRRVPPVSVRRPNSPALNRPQPPLAEPPEPPEPPRSTRVRPRGPVPAPEPVEPPAATRSRPVAWPEPSSGQPSQHGQQPPAAAADEPDEWSRPVRRAKHGESPINTDEPDRTPRRRRYLPSDDEEDTRFVSAESVVARYGEPEQGDVEGRDAGPGASGAGASGADQDQDEQPTGRRSPHRRDGDQTVTVAALLANRSRPDGETPRGKRSSSSGNEPGRR